MFPTSTKILIVDDMGSIRTLVKNNLMDMGFSDIVESSDGEKAMAVLTQCLKSHEPVQLIISDWNMPIVDGMELFKQVRAMTDLGPIPFVMLTSESELEQVTTAILAGISNFIVKPFTKKILEEKLNAVWVKQQKQAQKSSAGR
jgi:two-component system chemotaxis response regulator CheY